MTPVPVQIQSVWDAIPSTNCEGLCAGACGPVHASDVERQILAEHGIRIAEFTVENVLAELVVSRDCPALVDGRCSVYEVRPTICRLWGAVEDLPCPWGCEPDGGRLDPVAAGALLRRSKEHGQRRSRAARRR